MNWFSRQRRKHMMKKICSTLEKHSYMPCNEIEVQINEIIREFNDSIADDTQYRSEIPKLFNEILFLNDSIHILIHLMAVFSQQTNNEISTLIQSPYRCGDIDCFPIYLINHKETFNLLVSYLNFNNLASTASILIRSCIKSRIFTEFLFQKEMVLTFIRFTNTNTFEKTASAFKIFEDLLLTHPSITGSYITQQYQLYSFIFKAILSSSCYLNKAMFLPVLFELIVCEECKGLLMLFLADQQYLQLIIPLLRDDSKKIKQGAYNLFKLFVFNPQPPDNIMKILSTNKDPLVRAIRKIKIPHDCPELIEERATIVATLRTM